MPPRASRPRKSPEGFIFLSAPSITTCPGLSGKPVRATRLTRFASPKTRAGYSSRTRLWPKEFTETISARADSLERHALACQGDHQPRSCTPHPGDTYVPARERVRMNTYEEPHHTLVM